MSYQDRVPFGRSSIKDFYAAMTRGERLLVWLAVVNFVVFFGISIPLGGDAVNGTARAGHYYLMEHGIYTEVSRPIFIYSTIHTLSLLITHALGIFACLRARFRTQELSRRG